ncbi:MAG: poly(3-hydroxyalkanoate) depolymerase [Panacagrimonas sp.]
MGANDLAATPPQLPAVRKMIVHRLRISGQKIRVAIWPGDSRPVPLLLFNGIGARLELLLPFVAALGNVETIAFDVPGTGESPNSPYPYRLWMLARLVVRMLDKLGYGRVDVLGVSWGGALAQQFAVQYPGRCRRLVLAATAQGMPLIPGRLSILLKLITPRRYNDPVYRRKIAGEIYGGAARTRPGLVRELGPLMTPTSKLGYFFQQLALAGWSSVPFLPFLRQPTLIMAGNDDPVIPLINARVMAKLIPRSRLHVVDDGHLFLISNADESSAVIRSFLDAEEPLTGGMQ